MIKLKDIMIGICLCIAAPAMAEEFPSAPVTVIVPHGAGGGTDLLARFVAGFASRELGQSIAVVNIAGGGTAIGAQEAARSEPDGYTLLATHIALLTSSAMGANTMGPQSLRPVAQVAFEPQLIAVRTDSNLNSLADFYAAAAQAGSNPKLGISAGAANHFAFLQMLAEVEDAQVNFVPIGGGGASIKGLLGNSIDVGMFTVSEVIEQVRGGALKAITIFSPERHPDLPDVATAVEQGYPLDIGLHYVWYAPKATPDERVEKLADALEKTVADEAFKEEMLQRSIMPSFVRGAALEAALDERWTAIQKIAKAMK